MIRPVRPSLVPCAAVAEESPTAGRQEVAGPGSDAPGPPGRSNCRFDRAPVVNRGLSADDVAQGDSGLA